MLSLCVIANEHSEPDTEAIVLIPRKPLASDHEYRVNVKSHRYTHNWTFRTEQTTRTVNRAPEEYNQKTRRAR
jgi:hypothetical protein